MGQSPHELARTNSVDGIILETNWQSAKTDKERKFCTGLRGEEMFLLVDLAGTTKSIKRFMKEDAMDPCFHMHIVGRTKGNQKDMKPFAAPCVKVTEGRGLGPGVWVKQLVDLRILDWQRWWNSRTTFSRCLKRSRRRLWTCFHQMFVFKMSMD
jgi:hypothetical protein